MTLSSVSIPWQVLAGRIDGEVHADLFRRYLLSTDGSIFRETPAAVVYPRTAEDVAAVVVFAREHRLSVHARGAGSGLCGSALGTGIVVDFTKFMNRLVGIDLEQKRFSCEPGYRFGELEAVLKGSGLFFPPDPSSGEYASFGGMYGTNASGAHSVKYGNVSDYILDAEIVASDGRIITLSEIRNTPFADLPENFRELARLYTENAAAIEGAYPPIRCNVAGYNLRGLVRDGRLRLEKLFAGAEGTLGVVTRLVFRLMDQPAHDSLVVAFFSDILKAAEAVRRTLPMEPSGIEVMDKSLLALAKQTEPALRDKIPDGIDNVLLLEFDGRTTGECQAAAQSARDLLMSERLSDNAHIAVSGEEKARFWAVRKAAVPILYKLKGRKKILALIEDAAVPTDGLVAYFQGIYAILQDMGVDFVVYGHIAKGLLHTRPLLDLKDPADVAKLRPIADRVFELVHSLGGTVSGEHGDGRLRSAYIRRRYPEIHSLFLKTKALLDPDGMFNPEIKTRDDPDQMARKLRFGAAYRTFDPADKTLLWPEGFTLEAEKCHGCTKCTTVTTATRMCPVYKFTRDESAAPKAKANLLRGMLGGALPDRAVYDRAFQQVMDQCVMCGSCAMECPSNVDIPKLAAEAKAFYIRKFGPSPHQRLVTGLELAGRTLRKVSAAFAPVMKYRAPRRLAAPFTGISAERDFIAFPARSFFDRTRPVEGGGDIRVLYFVGCYSGYIRPEIGEAAVRVLNRMGMQVLIPDQHCCGLPMLSKGMTAAAARKVRENLGKWRDLLNRVDYITVTCSSCGYALMKDWRYLLNAPETAEVARKMIHITHLVDRYRDRLGTLAPSSASAAYHHPCHLRIQPEPGRSLKLISGLPGLSVTELKCHCCGMAGSWGMGADHFDLSRKIGDDMIAKLNASGADFGITDCPTCRLQMEQFTDLTIRHPIQMVDRCLT